MKPASLVTALLALAPASFAAGVVGSPPGFAASTTGGGSATAQYPSSLDQLKEWLTDSTPRVIVLNKEYVRPLCLNKVNKVDSISSALKARRQKLAVGQHPTPALETVARMRSTMRTG